jgi:hypothetical protein
VSPTFGDEDRDAASVSRAGVSADAPDMRRLTGFLSAAPSIYAPLKQDQRERLAAEHPAASPPSQAFR